MSRNGLSLSAIIISVGLLISGCGGGGGGGSDNPGATDTTAPTVSSTSPANGSADVAMNSSISATFSEGMDASTINGTTFSLSGGSGSVSGTVTCNGSTATFTPSSSLSYNTTYTAMITTGAKDAAGNAVASSYSWSFTTEALSVPSAPSGLSATPGDGQATISWDTVSGATSYNIYWSTSTGVTKTNGTNISNAISPYTHTGRANGTTYYYVITAVNSSGESSESSQLSATPQATPVVAGQWDALVWDMGVWGD